MFVRWKRKRRKDTYHLEPFDPSNERSWRKRVPDQQWLRSAVLVESVRVEGRPRQRTIRYLGSIRESYLDPENDASIFHWGDFWRTVDANLEDLNISDMDRARILAALEDVVPRPDPVAHANALEEAKARMAYLKAQLR